MEASVSFKMVVTSSESTGCPIFYIFIDLLRVLEHCFLNFTLRPNTQKLYFFQVMGFISLSCWKMCWRCEISDCHIGDWILLSSRVLCHVVWWICTSVLQELDHLHLEGGTKPWRWRQYVSLIICTYPPDYMMQHCRRQYRCSLYAGMKMWFHFSVLN